MEKSREEANHFHECVKEVEELVMMALLFPANPRKPGDLIKRFTSHFKHLHELTPEHFQNRIK